MGAELLSITRRAGCIALGVRPRDSTTTRATSVSRRMSSSATRRYAASLVLSSASSSEPTRRRLGLNHTNAFGIILFGKKSGATVAQHVRQPSSPREYHRAHAVFPQTMLLYGVAGIVPSKIREHRGRK